MRKQTFSRYYQGIQQTIRSQYRIRLHKKIVIVQLHEPCELHRWTSSDAVKREVYDLSNPDHSLAEQKEKKEGSTSHVIEMRFIGLGIKLKMYSRVQILSEVSGIIQASSLDLQFSRRFLMSGVFT